MPRLDALRAHWAPQGSVEQALVERIAHLLMRRERLLLAERVVHLMAVEDATDAETDRKRLAKCAGVGHEAIKVSEDIASLLAPSEADDAATLEKLADNRASSASVLAILEAGGKYAYERALAALDYDGRSWWTEWLAHEQTAETPDLHPTAESLPGGGVEKTMAAPYKVCEGRQCDPRWALQNRQNWRYLATTALAELVRRFSMQIACAPDRRRANPSRDRAAKDGRCVRKTAAECASHSPGA